MKQWIQSILESPYRHAMPLMTYPGLLLTGKSVQDVVMNAEHHSRCVQALAAKYPSTGVVHLMDLSLEAEAFGSPIAFSEEEVPFVSGRLVSDADSIQQLSIPDVGAGRTSEFLKAVALTAAAIKGKPIFGGTIGPFSLAGRLFDIAEAMTSMLLEPEIMHVLLDKCTNFLTEYAKAIKQAGANGLLMAEPAAGLLSPGMCHEFSSTYVKRIIDTVQSDDFTVILHNCGNTEGLIESMLSTGAKAIHLGNAVNIAEILPRIPAPTLLFGNVDPAHTFRHGTPEQVYKVVRSLLQETASYANYVISSGCDIPPGTPIENVESFFRAVKDFNSAGEK
ncbi:MAG: uroporphyrinogen decarboxylase family protein [bacterium]